MIGFGVTTRWLLAIGVEGLTDVGVAAGVGAAVARSGEEGERQEAAATSLRTDVDADVEPVSIALELLLDMVTIGMI